MPTRHQRDKGIAQDRVQKPNAVRGQPLGLARLCDQSVWITSSVSVRMMRLKYAIGPKESTSTGRIVS